MPSEPGSIRILVVDDHRMFADALSLLLEADERFTVVGIATNGADALAQASRASADVILMDVALPGSMDGLEATKRLRRARPDLRVIILTGLDDESLPERAREAGASACLRKTTAESLVRETIADVVEARAQLP